MPPCAWLALPTLEARDRLRRLRAAARRPRTSLPALEPLEDRALPSVTVTVDATDGLHAINPNIYGVTGASTAALLGLNAPLDRFDWGGDGRGHGGDDGHQDSPGERLNTFIAGAKAAGAAVEVPVSFGGADADDPNAVSFVKTLVQQLVARWGPAASGGVGYYALDGVRGLWGGTHGHGDSDRVGELVASIEAYAGAIKSADPSAVVVLEPAAWGWGGDRNDDGSAGTAGLLPAFLQQLHQQDTAAGRRSVDVLSVPFLPRGGVSGDDISTSAQLLRNESTRSLWDPSYVGPGGFAGPSGLIPLLKSWVAAYDPGLQVGVTGYDWGAENHVNGATAQADVLGIFGREGLDLATRREVPASGSPAYLAEQLYRNYDGKGSAFGDTGISATSTDTRSVSAFAAVRSSDGALTLVIDAKALPDPGDPSATVTVTVSLAGFDAAGLAQGWQLAASDPSDPYHAAITRLGDVHFDGDSLTVTVPRQSVTLFVIPRAPAGTFQFSAAAYAAAENSGTFAVTVTRTGGTAGGVTVHYATSDGTGVAGVNYVAASGTLTFAAGETSKTFLVTLLDDGVVNGDTTVGLTLSAPGSGGALGTPASAVLTVQETDLTHDERFVQGLYNDFLGRSGSTQELDGWVALIPTLGRVGVAGQIAYSGEALSRVVDSMYQRLLGRAADLGGLDFWVGQLQSGSTEEQVAAALIASPEFAARADALVGGTNPDANFVQSLYQLLLGRTASDAEVNGWLSTVAAQGRAAVAAAFLASGEFRTDAVRTFYGDPTQTPSPWEPWMVDLLHRTAAPSAAEVGAWVTSGTDSLTIEVTLAGSSEYYNNH